MAFNLVFKRHEAKYMLTLEQYNAAWEYLSDKMTVDSYGKSTICNVYFDTEDFNLAKRSCDKPVYKEKLRLRSYGTTTDDSVIFLEIKRKYKGIVYKRRIPMKPAEFEAYYKSRDRGTDAYNRLFDEADWFFDLYKPVPKALISYDRVALYGNEDKDFRVTFDNNILCRSYDLSLSSPVGGIPIMNKDCYLMEVKVSGGMPLWFNSFLCREKLLQTSFSKYGTYYKTCLMKDEKPRSFESPDRKETKYA